MATTKATRGTPASPAATGHGTIRGGGDVEISARSEGGMVRPGARGGYANSGVTHGSVPRSPSVGSPMPGGGIAGELRPHGGPSGGHVPSKGR